MFRQCRAAIFDLEGVLYAGKEILPGGREVTEILRARSFPFCYITNNSSQTGAQVAAHMHLLGFEVRPGQIVSALDLAGEWLRRASPGGRVMVMGSASLRESLGKTNFELISPEEEERAEIVLVGRDEDLTYFSLSAAARAVHRGARFVALNPDVRAPIEGGGFHIGGGAVAAAVRAAAGRAPELIGKPAPFLFETALAWLGTSAGETLMVGDNLRTDIAGGRGMGMPTVWVNRWGHILDDPDVKPDLEVNRVDALVSHL